MPARPWSSLPLTPLVALFSEHLQEVPDNKRKLALFKKLSARKNQLSTRKAAIASFILNNYRKVAFMTSTELASHVGVNESTVIRFASSLGYKGYPDLRRHLYDVITEELTTTESIELEAGDGGADDDLRMVVEKEIANLTQLTKAGISENLDKAAQELITAKRVFVLGLRASTGLAQLLGYSLAKVHEDVIVLTQGGSSAVDAFRFFPTPSLILAIGFPRYPRETVELLSFAKREGIRSVALTDTPFSPLGKIADLVIPVQTDFISFIPSYCAPLATITALVVRVALKNRKKTEARLKRFEAMAEQQRLFSSGHTEFPPSHKRL